MIYATGAEKSKYDMRTFSYVPTKANIKGGTKYEPDDIEDQHKVGICTAIAMTMNARKAWGMKFSADFQYLIQKKYVDKNWSEGSSAFSALRVGRGGEDKDGKLLWGGFLPEEHWKFTTIEDRKLPYSKYIEKLKAIPESEIEELFEISKNYRLAGYAKVPVERDMLANAIDESKSGLIVRFVLGNEWWTKPVEPLRKPAKATSGHLVTHSNYNGGSFRIANSWGTDWADGGTAYHLLGDYAPTEAWIPYYEDLPKPIQDQKEDREKIIGKIKDYLQKIISLLDLLI
jgi:hypothetical protein